ncbi:TadE family type IV pilus minor pilin [Acrocarpospora sp. B8E8]|uniref:TadE family type IV pilus minor pilin n=1 Tax=Acrocarpospora sp. B8E8 TaxID=3153572 RepID=UPI00325F1E5E
MFVLRRAVGAGSVIEAKLNSDEPRLIDPEPIGSAPIAPGSVAPGSVCPRSVCPGLVEPGLLELGFVDPWLVESGPTELGLVGSGLVGPGLVGPGLVGSGLVGAESVESRGLARDELVEGGPRRPGSVEAGSVTAEIAVALPALVVVLGAALWAVAVVCAQLECVDAARAGARAAARGESVDAVRAVVLRWAPEGAQATVAVHGDLARVEVIAKIRPVAGLLVRPFTVSATASSAAEPGVTQ